MKIQGIHHVAILCSDYEKSKDFYTRVLGFEILHEAFRSERQSYKLDLKVPDGTQIELFSFPNPPPRVSRPEARGLRHLAFSVQSIEEAVAHLKKHQVECEPVRTDEFTAKKFTFFADPDDLPIELYETP